MSDGESRQWVFRALIWEFDRGGEVKNRTEFNKEEKDQESFFFQEKAAWTCLQQKS